MPDADDPRNRAMHRNDAPAFVARRMLAAAATAREVLPDGFSSPGGTDLLLAILIAEDRGDWPTSDSVIATAGVSAETGIRWLRVLADRQLIDQRGKMLALTDTGYELIARLTARVQSSQCGDSPLLS